MNNQRPVGLWPLAAWIGALGRRGRDEWAAFAELRVPVLLIVLLGAGLFLISPAQDALRNMGDAMNPSLGDLLHGERPGDRGVPVQWVSLLVACVITGVNAWFWPLVLYKFKPCRPGETVADEPFWHYGTRRALALAPLGIATVLLWYTATYGLSDVAFGLIPYLATMVVLFWLFVARRKRIRARPTTGPIHPGSLDWLYRKLGGVSQATVSPGESRFIIGMVALSLVVLALLTCVSTRDRVALFLGPAALVFLSVGLVIPIVSLLQWGLRALHLPVILPVLLLATLVSRCNDNNGVRAMSIGKGEVHYAFPSLAEAYGRWQEAHRHGPLILVASPGGASRAAYWTATVMSRLDDETQGQFSDRTFAISAVSGGSLGAIGYTAWLSHFGGRPECDRLRDAFVRRMIGADYLSAAVAGLLYPDLVQRFLPGRVMPSRANLLEQGWERGWRDAVRMLDAGGCKVDGTGDDALAGDFQAIWRNPSTRRWVPLVFANGSLAETGKRVITAPVPIDPTVFLDSPDFYRLFPARIRASTAIHNTARFPVISPAGRLAGVAGASGRVTGHIIDGGYFENGGIATLYEIAREIHHLDPTRRILLVELDNDDTASCRDARRIAGEDECHDAGRRIAAGEKPAHKGFGRSPWLYEVAHIATGLFRTRFARQLLEAKQVARRDAGDLNAAFIRVGLAQGAWDHPVATSWLLSYGSRRAMDMALLDDRRFDQALNGMTADYSGERLDNIRKDLCVMRRHHSEARARLNDIRNSILPPAGQVAPPDGATDPCIEVRSS